MLFGDLPAETIQAILFFLPPETLVNFCQTSKRSSEIADTPLLWRYHCRTLFRFWDPSHEMPMRFSGPVNKTDWKRFFKHRMLLSHRIDDAMNKLVNGSTNKIEIIGNMLKWSIESSESKRMAVRDYSMDVKDALLRHCNAQDKEEDHLARRFWARAALEKLNRALAIKEWKYLSDTEDSNSLPSDLEGSLAAFDLFVSDSAFDLGDITSSLDTLASQLRNERLDFDLLTTRNKAITLAQFLRSHNFIGTSEDNYHSLPNNFVGIALREATHQAIPLICAAIYCFVAQRVGLAAYPCAFPMHVYTVVEPPAGVDLDGRSASSPNYTPNPMYIDAFREAVEVPISHLHAQLRAMGAGDLPDNVLTKASNASIVIRSSRNIMHSVQIMQMQVQNPRHEDDRSPPLWFSQVPDMDHAFYASLWSTMMLSPNTSTGISRRRHYLPFLCEHIQAHCPWDADLLERYITPLFARYPERLQTSQIVEDMMDKDTYRPTPLRRSPEVDAKVYYKVGQVFRHQRYGYEGVIVGWDAVCGAPDAWINHIGVDNLEGGQNQSFYHVLVDEKSTRYVAQENIRATYNQPSPALMRLAGRYFQRWDPEVKRFISNIKADYPDD